MNQIERQCEGLILTLSGVLIALGIDAPYSMWEPADEWNICWYDEESYRNSLSCWTDNGDGIWSKAKDGKSIDEYEFNATTDNDEDIIIRILTGEEK